MTDLMNISNTTKTTQESTISATFLAMEQHIQDILSVKFIESNQGIEVDIVNYLRDVKFKISNRHRYLASVSKKDIVKIVEAAIKIVYYKYKLNNRLLRSGITITKLTVPVEAINSYGNAATLLEQVKHMFYVPSPIIQSSKFLETFGFLLGIIN